MAVPGALGGLALTVQELAALGLSEQGVNAIKDHVVKPFTQESTTENKFDTTQIDKILNDFANTLQKLGINNAALIGSNGKVDPEKVMSYLGSTTQIFADPNAMNLIQAMNEFAVNANYIKAEDPQVGSDFLKFVGDTYNRTLSINETIKRINDLNDKLMDRANPKDEYVVAMLKKNYSLASILTMMYSFGRADKETFAQMSMIQKTALEMLGPQSVHLLNDKALISEKARSNFDKIQKSRATFHTLTPVQIQMEKWKQAESEWLSRTVNSDTAKVLVSDPFIGGIIGFAGNMKSFVTNLGSRGIGELIKE